jgi:hypothetical protein
MKKLIICALVMMVCGCDGKPTYRDGTATLTNKPEALKDCLFIEVDPGGLKDSYLVIRCPNSSTTMHNVDVDEDGNTSVQRVITIDGNQK